MSLDQIKAMYIDKRAHFLKEISKFETNQNNISDIETCAHNLIGAASYFNDHNLLDLCKTLDSKIKQGDITNSQILSLCQDIKTELSNDHPRL